MVFHSPAPDALAALNSPVHTWSTRRRPYFIDKGAGVRADEGLHRQVHDLENQGRAWVSMCALYHSLSDSIHGPNVHR